MDCINMVELIDELELNSALASELDTALTDVHTATPANAATAGDAELRLFDDLFAFDNADLLRLVQGRREATAVELHLADRLASAVEALEELEAMLRLDHACPVTRRARRAALH